MSKGVNTRSSPNIEVASSITRNNQVVNINYVNFYGRSHLIKECMKDKNSVNINKIMYLIQNGVDINLLYAFEWTALMYAVEKNNVELVKLLLQHGSNKFIKGRIFSAYGGKIERTLINWHKEKQDTKNPYRYGTVYDLARTLDRRNIKNILK
jgi:hypothetical protein